MTHLAVVEIASSPVGRSSYLELQDHRTPAVAPTTLALALDNQADPRTDTHCPDNFRRPGTHQSRSIRRLDPVVAGSTVVVAGIRHHRSENCDPEETGSGVVHSWPAEAAQREDREDAPKTIVAATGEYLRST